MIARRYYFFLLALVSVAYLSFGVFIAIAGHSFDMVKWRVASNTNNFWYVASYWSSQFNTDSDSNQVVIAMPDQVWEKTNTQAKADIFWDRFIVDRELLTVEKVSIYTGNHPKVSIIFTDDAYAKLTSEGLEPIPTEPIE